MTTGGALLGAAVGTVGRMVVVVWTGELGGGAGVEEPVAGSSAGGLVEVAGGCVEVAGVDVFDGADVAVGSDDELVGAGDDVSDDPDVVSDGGVDDDGDDVSVALVDEPGDSDGGVGTDVAVTSGSTTGGASGGTVALGSRFSTLTDSCCHWLTRSCFCWASPTVATVVVMVCSFSCAACHCPWSISC